jgi:hypothetical protein
MASGPVYSVSFLGTTKNYYVDVSADAGESGRQFLAMVEDFKALGLALGSFFLRGRGPGGRPVGFSAGLRGEFDIVSTLGSKSSGSPAASPAASPSSTPRSAASASSTAKAVASIAGVVRSSFAILPAANMEAVADLLLKLKAAAGVVPGDFLLHRMMMPPSSGTGEKRVDLTVNPAGEVTGGAVSTSIHLPTTLLRETHDFMFLSAHAPSGTGCFFFPASLARSVGFDVIQDEVILASDAGDPIVLHVSLKPQYGTPLKTVLAWVSQIEAASTGCVCAMKAAAEDAAPPTSPLPWMSLAAASLLPMTSVCQQSCIVDPLCASASSSAAKLQRASSIDDCVDPSFAWVSDDVVNTAPFPASEAREEVA